VIAEGYGSVVWRRGFVDEVKYVGDRHLAHKKAVGWLVKLMTTVHEPFSLLRVLDLSYTDIVDLTPLGKFPHLARLELRGCQPSTSSREALAVSRPRLKITP
jgi:hypothetical protein